MMFSRFSAFAVSALLAAATTSVVANDPTNQCTTGEVQCCNSLEPGNSTIVDSLLSLLGVVIDDVEGLVGITCTPISILGFGQGSCNEQPVCCSNNSFNGIIAIGCVPININL
ncbi:hypothetical protein CVT26_016169 [Gymnopilus dilepis]|uniref:Hydrophobin n=1 Tax=Gymnopilus dilepis TaxID=231916 RepID=A0A409XZ00_9AGAR|nr:hypothetical protein CVT26_016169 [Gymnopilus dilepis]